MQHIALRIGTKRDHGTLFRRGEQCYVLYEDAVGRTWWTVGLSTLPDRILTVDRIRRSVLSRVDAAVVRVTLAIRHIC